MTVLNLSSNHNPATPVDLFVTAPFPFMETYERATLETLDDGTPFRFVDLRTLMDMKRAAGREKDLLDRHYLELLVHEA